VVKKRGFEVYVEATVEVREMKVEPEEGEKNQKPERVQRTRNTCNSSELMW